MMNVSPLALLMDGCVDTIPAVELEKKLDSGRPLRIKLGADPTAPDLHLGHAVVLSKLKEFQDMGHAIIFLIGDFTARIGDPTGRSKTRPPLSDEEIAHNSKTYFDQVGKILDMSKVSIRYNAEWLSPLTSRDWVSLCAKVTLARLVERDDFAQRLAAHVSIGFHELLYPIMQGYDSVALAADVELGGTDQTFNLLMGRFLQEQFHMEPQVIMTVPLLEGITGGSKMSKSQGNTIGLSEPAEQAFGKLMSISDTLMWHYVTTLRSMPADLIVSMQHEVAAGLLHPMAAKKRIAHSIIARFWGADDAVRGQHAFEQIFQQGNYQEIPPFDLSRFFPAHEPVWIVALVKVVGGCESSSQARRLIESGAVTIDGIKIVDTTSQLMLLSGMVIKIGKHRFYRIV